MALTFRGGIYLPQDKKSKEIRVFGTPKMVSIPLGDCAPTVKAGDRVEIGCVIAANDNECTVHASVSGAVIAVDENNIIIENDFENRLSGDIKPYDGSFDELGPDEIIDTVRRAGIPEYKLIESAKGSVDTLILNCVESEPYLSAVYRLITEASEAVLGGVKILLKALGLRAVDIAIDENMSDVIKLIRDRTKDGGYTEIRVVKSIYPQADERQLVYAITGQETGADQAPVDVGCVVFDARTCIDVYNAFVYGMPLINRSITVDGDCIGEPSVVRCPVGTSFAELIDFCGGITGDIKYLINGGPMTGKAVPDTEAAVTKDSVALLALSDNTDVFKHQPSSCIRCGRCVENCPMGLMPNYIATYATDGKYHLCEKYGVASCIGCGVCSYVCPANIPITHLCREAKSEINKKGGEE